MLKPISKLVNPPFSRRVRASTLSGQVFKKKKTQPPEISYPKRTTPIHKKNDEQYETSTGKIIHEAPRKDHVKRNELGVQLLSRPLHSQIFRNVNFPAPDPSYIQIAREHLEAHGLDPAHGSVLPDISFTLPPLQGADISEHFYRIGTYASAPYLDFAKTLANSQLPPKPSHWDTQSGWTKYYYLPDGSSYSEHVEYPIHAGQQEQLLVFDVETMPVYHPYAILATAASPNAWYAWISPWLLDESEEPAHHIPLGNSSAPRIVVGHNVSYDRARIKEEYSLKGTETRFLDTMALHVAVKGISSNQRPAWAKHRKNKEKEREQREEAVDVIRDLMNSVDERSSVEMDPRKIEELTQLKSDMADSLSRLENNTDAMLTAGLSVNEEDNENDIKRWEDLTSVNSLADVAQLHCGITMDKSARNDLMTLSPSEIRENVNDYLDYCASDVAVTHAVYASALPSFLAACPHPVSFAGILTMGSSFLPVNQEWQNYIARAEAVYHELEEKVQAKLTKLAQDAKELMDSASWKDDVWLSQLDWTPKVAGKSRGVVANEVVPDEQDKVHSSSKYPTWYIDVLSDPFDKKLFERVLPLLLRLSFDGHPLQYTYKEKWHFVADNDIHRIPTAGSKKVGQILNTRHALTLLEDGRMKADDIHLASKLASGEKGEYVQKQLKALAQKIYETTDPKKSGEDPWFKQLDWTLLDESSLSSLSSCSKRKKRQAKTKPVKPAPVYWPKWYWEAAKPKADRPSGTVDITVRNRIAPLLLHLSWLGHPLFHSREHGWTFRLSAGTSFTTRSTPLKFYDPADDKLAEDSLHGGYIFYKLPHKDGEKANVGSPLGKTFVKFAVDGTLRSPGEEAREALEMNVRCSYWISARDRIMNQMIRWQSSAETLGFPTNAEDDGANKGGIIIPQMITMGTVTRRAIEKTWLTASNAKPNRVGSELKAMVRAPPGYALVGADVDSEELWISSCMGDAQFGLHGATAIGWMTLEGTKSAGTDLHSKTANILGISRDQAKIFNYSRIYGAGMRHVVLLLLQSNASMLPERAQKLAEELYASTKGKNTHRTDIFGRKFWYGGSESFVFNKLEEIALSDKPQTPALGCGVTYALSKDYLPATFGSDYMPSRINWVVQSSGVDYLHLLIVSMDYLIAKYDLSARFLISVHDEVRYLAKKEDKYRTALALQIANVWTRSLFAYRLGMDDLPQGVAFFSSVDIDHVLRKEVDMSCVTPSQRTPIPPGESLDIADVLQKTHGGSLWKDGRRMTNDTPAAYDGNLQGYIAPDCLVHRASNSAFLRAQASSDLGEVKGLAQQLHRKVRCRGLPNNQKMQLRKTKSPLLNGEGYDWSDNVERLLGSYH